MKIISHNQGLSCNRRIFKIEGHDTIRHSLILDNN
jgi:hypothetical protein